MGQQRRLNYLHREGVTFDAIVGPELEEKEGLVDMWRDFVARLRER